MHLAPLDLFLQSIAWFLALVEVIVGLYVLVLNAWHPANRHVSALLLLFALNSYALGLFLAAADVEQARTPSLILAVTTPVVQPALLAIALLLLKPAWLRGGRQKWAWLVYAFILLPVLVTLLDVLWGTGLWYSGLDPRTYTGGFTTLFQYTHGRLAHWVRVPDLYLASLLLTALLVSVIANRKTAALEKRLSWVLLSAQILSMVVLFGFSGRLYGPVVILASTTSFVLAYGFAAFQQMLSEQRAQRGRLPLRLTALILAVTVPLVVAVVAYITGRSAEVLRDLADNQLYRSNATLAEEASAWLDSNRRALEALAGQPGLRGMDPAQQEPLLQAAASRYPGLELEQIATFDREGRWIASSRAWDLTSGRIPPWFRPEDAPQDIPYLATRPAGERPVLVFSAPIRDGQDQAVGLVMLASRSEALRNTALAGLPGSQAQAELLDSRGQPVLGTRLTIPAGSLASVSPAPTAGRPSAGWLVSWADSTGQRWRTVLSKMENGWTVIVQQPEAEALAPLRQVQQASFIVVTVGTLSLLGLSWLTIRQSLRPIQVLTQAAQAMSVGDLDQVVPVESTDEIGLLSQTFNSMGVQLRELITNLEQRVSERTLALQRRAVQLQVAAEVAREAASIPTLEQLLDGTVKRISERFGFYHAGIFLLDDAQMYAVLRAASSPGGQRMLARSHRLKAGQEGIVGYAAGRGEPRIALDVGQDAVFFNNPDLPETRSEMALPLSARGRIIGVLDVQSTQAGAFTREDIEILQILADQLALAIDNARLFESSQRALHELEQRYGAEVGAAWRRQAAQATAYIYSPSGVRPAPPAPRPKSPPGGQRLDLPLQLRGQSFGALHLQRETPWTEAEIELARAVLAQAALALENARLLADNHRRAQNEHLIGKIAAQAQNSLDLDTVMKRTVREIGQAFGSAKVQIRLERDPLSESSQPK